MSNETVVFNEAFLPMTMGIADNSVLTEIYQEYLHNLDSLLELLRAAPEKSDKLYIEVHKLKSSSASVGAHLLAGMLRDVEHNLLTRQGDIDANTTALLVLTCRQTHDLVSGLLGKLVTTE